MPIASPDAMNNEVPVETEREDELKEMEPSASSASSSSSSSSSNPQAQNQRAHQQHHTHTPRHQQTGAQTAQSRAGSAGGSGEVEQRNIAKQQLARSVNNNNSNNGNTRKATAPTLKRRAVDDTRISSYMAEIRAAEMNAGVGGGGVGVGVGGGRASGAAGGAVGGQAGSGASGPPVVISGVGGGIGGLGGVSAESISGGLTLDKSNTSLKNLICYIKTAYSSNLTSPKWKNFKGLRLQVSEKIRLNNVIWRTWFEQFGTRDPSKRKRPLVCQFTNAVVLAAADSQAALKSSAAARLAISEGKYWRRRLDSITNEYKKWRELSRKQIKSTNDANNTAAAASAAAAASSVSSATTSSSSAATTAAATDAVVVACGEQQLSIAMTTPAHQMQMPSPASSSNFAAFQQQQQQQQQPQQQQQQHTQFQLQAQSHQYPFQQQQQQQMQTPQIASDFNNNNNEFNNNNNSGPYATVLSTTGASDPSATYQNQSSADTFYTPNGANALATNNNNGNVFNPITTNAYGNSGNYFNGANTNSYFAGPSIESDYSSSSNNNSYQSFGGASTAAPTVYTPVVPSATSAAATPQLAMNNGMQYAATSSSKQQTPYNNRCRSPSPGLFQDFDLFNFSSDTLFSTYCLEDPKDPSSFICSCSSFCSLKLIEFLFFVCVFFVAVFGTNPDFFQPDLMRLYPNFDFLDLNLGRCF